MDEVERLTRELIGVQEMLGLVLLKTGPVEVEKDFMHSAPLKGAGIEIIEDKERESFVFRVVSDESLKESSEEDS